jgi:predicted RNA-binding Zn ribbon-like protein
MSIASQKSETQHEGRPARVFAMAGGRLCVDFANSVYSSSDPGDPLTSWSDLIGFLEQACLIGAERAELLRDLAATAPEATQGTFARALELRGALRSILDALSNGRAIVAGWAEPINALLRVTEGYDQLQPSPDGGWHLRFVEREKRLEWLLAAIARSAAKLVAEGPAAPVRKCANPNCVLYFYDDSRTGKRRWCSMAVCGNRNKVAEFARRTRQARTSRKRLVRRRPSNAAR